MTPEEVKEYYDDSVYQFGKRTGMSPSSLHNWLNWGAIPEESQYKIERLTKGKLKADPEGTMGKIVAIKKEKAPEIKAKLMLQAHIKFFESVIKNIKSDDKTIKNGAMITALCIDKYINEQLIADIQHVMSQVPKE